MGVVMELGPRVPLLIISPWAKEGYVDQTTFEFSSLVKLSARPRQHDRP